MFSIIAKKINVLSVFCSAVLLLAACVGGGGGGEGAAGPLGGPVGGPVQGANPDGTVGSAIESMDIEPLCPTCGSEEPPTPAEALGLDATHPYGIMKDGTQPISCEDGRELFVWNLSLNNRNISGQVISFERQPLPNPQLAILRIENASIDGNPCQYSDVSDQLEAQNPLLGSFSYFSLDGEGRFQGELAGEDDDLFVAFFNVNHQQFPAGNIAGEDLLDMLINNPWVAVFKVNIRDLRTPVQGVSPPSGFSPTGMAPEDGVRAAPD
ncbi:MAG: hypothetical protein R3257_06675 [bacterium]|nr:hypothetical protein [bacterium]